MPSARMRIWGGVAALLCSACQPGIAPPTHGEPAPAPLPPPAVDSAPPCPDEWPPARDCIEGVAAGGDRTCLVATPRSYCWFHDLEGTPVAGLSPARRSGLRDAAEQGSSCSIDAEGRVFCTGDLVGSAFFVPVAAPVPLPPGVRATRLAMGQGHLCVLTEGGEVYCQGQNRHGQLGDGTTRPTYDRRPRRVDLPPAKDIAVGDRHSCALTPDDHLYCWGLAPSPPGFRADIAGQRFRHGTYAGSLCVLSEVGDVFCRAAGSEVFDWVLDGVRDVEAMGGDVYALKGEGEVWAWSGAGDPRRQSWLEPASRLLPTAPCAAIAGSDVIRCTAIGQEAWNAPPRSYDVRGMVQVAAGPILTGHGSTCGASAGGLVSCWGGIGLDWVYAGTPPHYGPSLWLPGWRANYVDVSRPYPVRGATSIVELSPRGGCARDEQGRVYRLDLSIEGRRGRISLRTSPQAVGAVRLADSNACIGVRADGSLFRLESPPVTSTEPPFALAPVEYVELPELHGAVQIELGVYLDCARWSDGRARCRRSPNLDDTAGPFSVVLSDDPVERIVSNGGEACGLLSAGGVRCRAVERKELSPVRDPFSRGSTVPMRVF